MNTNLLLVFAFVVIVAFVAHATWKSFKAFRLERRHLNDSPSLTSQSKTNPTSENVTARAFVPIFGSYQCECGRLFYRSPFAVHLFVNHCLNGDHERAMRTTLCAPCFFSNCQRCEKKRGTWKCDCKHDFKQVFLLPSEMRENYIRHNRLLQSFSKPTNRKDK